VNVRARRVTHAQGAPQYQGVRDLSEVALAERKRVRKQRGETPQLIRTAECGVALKSSHARG